MKKAIRMSRMKLLSCLAAISFIIGTCSFASCQSADLVVYGKIFTAEDNQVAEALAVKDGKYVYVGDKKGAAPFVETGKTEVVDYTGKGLVMPGCGNGHAHYAMAYAMSEIGTQVDASDDPNKFLTEILQLRLRKRRIQRL